MTKIITPPTRVITYEKSIAVVAVLLPVRYLGKIYLMAVIRNQEPKEGGIALPGGRIPHMHNGLGGSSLELVQETGHFVPPNKMQYFMESAPALFNPDDTKGDSLYVITYKAPDVDRKDVNLEFRDEKEEIRGLTLIHLNENGDGLLNEYDEETILCFASHHRAAVNYLNERKCTP